MSSDLDGREATTTGAADPAARARAVIQGIGVEARRSNQGRAAELAEALARLGAGRLPVGDRERAVDVAHQLVGSAGTFGYQRASTLAREVELFLRRDGADPVTLAAAVRALALIQQDLAAEPED